MITLDDYWSSCGKYPLRVKYAPPDAETIVNAKKFVECCNALLVAFTHSRQLTSGYRPESVNKKIPGAAKTSTHITGEGGDFEDANHHFGSWCLTQIELLKTLGLFMEDPPSTWANGHIHLQTRPTKSGNIVFLP